MSKFKFPVPQFGPNLKRHRERKGLTQQQLAERLGVRQKYLSELERDDCNPPLGTAAAVASALGIRLERFLEKIPDGD